jgi:glycosyltransferase involved in cell wall biosynthesis
VSTAGHAGTTVAYLTKRFPRLSETFILDEILGLEAAGVPLRLYAGADPGERVTQPDVARVKSAVSYLHQPGVLARLGAFGEAWLAHTALLAADPRRYLRALVHLLRHPDRRTTIRHFITAGRLIRRMRADRARHLHAAFAHTPASIAHYAHLLSGLPFSFAGHAKDLYTSNPVALAARARAAEFVLVCSESAARELERRAGPSAHVVLQYHGVDAGRFAPHRRQNRPGDTVKILAVGRLVEKKGYPVLLEAIATVVRTGRRVSLEIVGSGAQRAALEDRIRRLGLEQIVTLTGARTHQQIATAYGSADVFAQASMVLANGDRDGIPNSLLEAMASGVPVVASAVAGIPEVLRDGVTGLLVPSGDADALAHALIRCVDSPGLRQRLGAAARAHVVAELDRRTAARRVASLFEAVALA